MLQNDEFTKDLFRFLQLLCEGHNGGELVLYLTDNWCTVLFFIGDLLIVKFWADTNV